MRIAVCDDEEAQRKLIIHYLKEWALSREQKMETAEFPDGESFLFLWEEELFDLLILDIEMGALSGIELAKKVRKKDEEIPILFITGYETYMAQGYEVSAIQYLLKPLYKEKLFTVLDKLLKSRKPEEKKVFYTEEGTICLAPSEIWFAEAAAHYSIIYTKDREYHLRHSITELLKMLDKQKEFVRCHRSYLVNLKHISAITRTEIILDDAKKLPVSRSAHKAVNAAFIKNYGVGCIQ